MDQRITEKEKQEIDHVRILLRAMSQKDKQFLHGFLKGAEVVISATQGNKQSSLTGGKE